MCGIDDVTEPFQGSKGIGGVGLPACYAGLSYRTLSAFRPPAYAGGSEKPSLTVGLLPRSIHPLKQVVLTKPHLTVELLHQPLPLAVTQALAFRAVGAVYEVPS
ncbi:MAG TPA: hypothetical protein DCK99_20615 [Blastocatellia bacterium]|nr:hypothetical protein [Blastocatellia bacterium]